MRATNSPRRMVTKAPFRILTCSHLSSSHPRDAARLQRSVARPIYTLARLPDRPVAQEHLNTTRSKPGRSLRAPSAL